MPFLLPFDASKIGKMEGPNLILLILFMSENITFSGRKFAFSSHILNVCLSKISLNMGVTDTTRFVSEFVK